MAASHDNGPIDDRREANSARRLADAQGQHEPPSQIKAAAEDVRRLSGRAVEPEAHLSDREFLQSQPTSVTNVTELTVPQIQRASALADIKSYLDELAEAEQAGDAERVAHIRREIADREKYLLQQNSEGVVPDAEASPPQ